MNFFQKKILTLAAFIANISLTMVVAGVATFAWFQANMSAEVQVSSASMQITTSEPNESLQYEVLKYDDNLKAGRSYTGADAITNFKLPDYDSYILEKNQYANVIIRAEVSTPSLDTTNEEMTIDISRLASTFKTDNVIIAKTSSVVQFKATVYKYKTSGASEYTVNTASHNSIDETSPATKYQTASSYFTAKKTPTTFVPIRDNGLGNVVVNRKAEADTITIIPDLPTGLTLTNVVVYIECTYHKTLVDEFIDSRPLNDDTKYSLDGDISLIKFGKKNKTSNVSDATGKYIKVESDATASSGQYLPTFEASANVGKILKGSLANGTDSIDVTQNCRDVVINNATSSEPKSIDSTDTIDDDAFTYDRTAKTLKSKAGYYIGNNRAADDAYNMDVSTSPTNKTNNISFEDGHPVVTSNSGKMLQYYQNSNRMRYYRIQNPVDLYRYTENVAEMPTLVSIAITHAITKTTFYTGHKFDISGLEVTATYNDGSTAVVTNSCTFTSTTGLTTLVPQGRAGETVFENAETNKTVNISYTEGAVTVTNGANFTINIVVTAITSLSCDGTLDKIYYFVGDTFDPTGVTIFGEYNSGDPHVDVTSSATFSGYNMSSATTQTITASYDGKSVNVGTIYVRNKVLSINITEKELIKGPAYTESFSISVTYNNSVTISQTSTNGGSVSLSASSISYSKTDKTTSTSSITITAASAGTVDVAFASPERDTVHCIVKVYAPDYLLNASDKKPYTSTSTSNTNYETVTLDGIQYYSYGGYIYSGNLSLNKGNTGYYVQNKTSYGRKIKKIVITMTADAFSCITVYKGASAGAETNSVSATSTSSSLTKIYNLNETHEFFRIKRTSTSSHINISAIDVYLEDPEPEISLSQNALSLFKGNSNSSITISSNYFSGTPTYSATATTDANHIISSVSVSSSTLTINTNSVIGTATITVSAVYHSGEPDEESATATLTVTTLEPVSGITLTPTSNSITAGNTTTVSIALSPSSASNQSVTVSFTSGGGTVGKFDSSSGSSTSKSVTCTSGSGSFTVYGVAAGEMKFKAVAADGSGVESSVCTITVTAGSGYVISYSGNGNTGGTAVSANSAGNYVLSSNTWTRTGCTFVGWAVNTGNGYSKMAAGATVTGITSNITVKAIWQSTLTITRSSFSTKGGYAWYDWTQSTASGTSISGKGELYTTTATSMQFNKKQGNGWAALFNTTALPGRITKITATTASGTNRTWNAYVTSTACSLSGTSLVFGSNQTTVGSGVSVTTSETTLGTSTAGYTYFCVRENVNSPSYISQFKITFEIW